MKTQTDHDRWIRRLGFPQDVERAFQETYYVRLRNTLRTVFGLVALVGVCGALLHLHNTGSLIYFTVAIVNLLLLRLALLPKFPQIWQSLTVVGCLGTIIPTFAFVTQEPAFLCFTTFFVVVGCTILRLQFRWLVLVQIATQVVGVSSIVIHRPEEWLQGILFVLGSTALTFIPMLLTLNRERFERREFLATYLLTLERNNERNMRQQTERMLHILSQAIGSIVHDLGNPLTAVQTGAQTLLHFVADDTGHRENSPGTSGSPNNAHTGDHTGANPAALDTEIIKEFAEIILDGAEMLNYLRLSLIEQTRVLENKPTPIEPQPTSLRRLVQAGARYQKPKFSSGRQVSLIDDDLEICVDEMKIITVFMNLIGNALKYSDGAVHVTWKRHKNILLAAVCDQGIRSRGISWEQAQQLFTPFGRLDSHAQIEGTGLGLLSVQKIVEAHGGEVYIEGYQDGTPGSDPFSTAQGTYLASDALPAADESRLMRNKSMLPQQLLLPDGFCTAFVVACPLKPVSHAQA
ncbi:MAG TPA: HAMP domain-containing sensor histidine kinase [Abditibacteriaceae bacterium]|jgi:signal transduction histidine kinase